MQPVYVEPVQQGYIQPQPVYVEQPKQGYIQPQPVYVEQPQQIYVQQPYDQEYRYIFKPILTLY